MKIQQLILVFLSSYFIAEADAQNSFSPFSFINSFLKSVPGWPLHHNRNALKNELSTINLFECLFFEFLIDWKSSNTFLKAFLQPGKTTEIHRPAAQSEDTKNFILQTSSRPGAVNYPFSGNNPAQVTN